jgi:F-box-like
MSCDYRGIVADQGATVINPAVSHARVAPMEPDPAGSHAHLIRSIDNDIESLKASMRALQSRRNSLASISRLPPEAMANIFSFLSSPGRPTLPSPTAKHDRLGWLRVAHVCHLWREIALNQPRFWSHIDFALTSAGIAEMLTRAKMAPLFLEAVIGYHWDMARISAFQEILEAHISHTAHLTITAKSDHFQKTLERLVSPAPTLEVLSLTNVSSGKQPLPWQRISIPDTLLGGTAPRLSDIELSYCDISWRSPLLKGLRRLEIYGLSTDARPCLEDWLNALNEMPQLEVLILHYSTPLAAQCPPLTSEPDRTVTLPFLTRIDITASAEDCTVALAHLVLPALTWLHAHADSYQLEGNDVQAVIPHISRNAHGPQDTEPLRSMLIMGERMRAEIFAWTVPDADVESRDSITSALSARVFFSASGKNWVQGTDAVIFDALLAALPINSLSTITAHNRLSKEVWVRRAPRLSLLERVRLFPTAVDAFREMLSEAEDVAPNSPLLPSLTTLILVKDALTVSRTYHLRDVLINRVEQGVPIETLDVRTCIVTDRAIQLLAEIVVDVVRGPAASNALKGWGPAFLDWNRAEYPYGEDEEGSEEFTEDEQAVWDEWVDSDDEYDDSYYEADYF